MNLTLRNSASQKLKIQIKFIFVSCEIIAVRGVER